jgi:hypothetical protein
MLVLVTAYVQRKCELFSHLTAVFVVEVSGPLLERPRALAPSRHAILPLSRLRAGRLHLGPLHVAWSRQTCLVAKAPGSVLRLAWSGPKANRRLSTLVEMASTRTLRAVCPGHRFGGSGWLACWRPKMVAGAWLERGMYRRTQARSAGLRQPGKRGASPRIRNPAVNPRVSSLENERRSQLSR